MKVIVEEEGERFELLISDPSVSVGRAPDNGVCLQSTRVSRHHCRIEFEGQGGWVTDLGSANGLVVNGERTRSAFLRAGEELELGGARLVLEPEALQADSLELAQRTQFESLSTGPGSGGALLRVLSLLAAGAGFGDVARRLVDEAIEQHEAERGFLLLDPELAGGQSAYGVEIPGHGELALVQARSFDRTDVPRPDVRLSASVIARALTARLPQRIVDAADDPELAASESIEKGHLRSILSAAVLIDGRPVGALLLDNRLAADAFSEEDADGIRAFTYLATILVRSAIQSEREQGLEREAEVLRTRLAAAGESMGQAKGSSSSPKRGSYEHILGKSSAMERVFGLLDRMVECDLPVMIRGESGTGKELVARAIHSNGARAEAAFISENCAALPDSLLESELFGHARGAFTGAERDKKGLIEQADGGTLFLDEIGDMTPEMQKKLLRVLQEHEVRPLGSDKRISVDVRLVAASHRDLSEMVRRGEFRQDLYYRVCVLELDLPPLRQRVDDIPLLARALLVQAATEIGREPPAISGPALDRLVGHHWPGNVRELENEMRRLVVLGSDVVLPDQLSESIGRGLPSSDESPDLFGAIDGDLRSAVAGFERRAINAALQKHDGNKSRAAQELGLSRFALQRKLDKYAEADADTEPGATTGD